ncbi:restriction endonuclease subunit S [Corallococcus sp. 4LFB]|uniref:restriction endonuclease subunit S n=1 Tax=Corallococcus sp. 4LFB TaxID=3383249 RepID=UPI003975E14E
MELKAESKHAGIEPLPPEWDIKSVRELGTIKTGPFGTLLKAGEYSGRSGVPLVSVGEIGVGTFRITKETPLVPIAVLQRLPQYVLRTGDIVFGRKGAVDRSALVTSSQNGWFLGSDGISIRPSVSCYPPYLAFQFQRHQVQAWLRQNAVGTTMASLNQEVLGRITVPCAPLPEQHAIADALSDVGVLIDTLDKLIAKKRDIKQAAMQQLFSGQVRLPSFSGKWEHVSLGTVGRWFSGGTPSMADDSYWSGDIPWVSPKDMKVSRLHDSIDHVAPSAIGNGTRLLPTGAILVVVRGMILAHSAPIARAERPVAFNQDIKGLVVKPGVDSNFVLWWLIAHEALLLATTNEATHGTKRIPTEALFKLQIGLPDQREQSAIAAVVSDMDAEIAALEQRREKTRLLKQGMMQELLTGRTRLV